VSLPDKGEFPPQLDAFMRAATGPSLQMRLRKASDLGFQERRISNFVSPSIGEVTEAGSLSGEQSRREGVLGRRGEGIAMGARKAGEISPDGDKSSPGLTHLQP
jgi:hypothetical protein